MNNIRTYGNKPYIAAVIHGGPGAAGDLKPVAEELSKHCGVIEPLQTKYSINDLVEELHSQISGLVQSPVTLIGHSWGAWLALLFAAEYPGLIKKLILIGSGPFEEKYTLKMMEERINHLSEEDKNKYFNILKNSNGIMTGELGNILSKADTYDLLPGIETEIEFDAELHLSVWNEAKVLRRNGKLMEYVSKLKCPVTAIHGDYDTHPAEGVSQPLAKVLKAFKMILLEKCGHSPWKERFARDKFFKILVDEIVHV
ncbi:MAG: alpha/beta hydrolase [Ignavibacteriae bacterium]|nr:MAG: alpha/beta hydrolase [Ignavibacteriota bacterium]